MAKLLLHIGSPKTGSSAIQKALKLTAPVLLASGVDVPESKLILADSPLDSGNGEWIANFCTGAWSAESARGKQVLHELERVLEQQENTIFSSENFFYSEENLHRVGDELAKKYSDIGIVLYLRNPVDMCHSLWMQAVKRTDSTHVHLTDYINDFSFDPVHVIKRFDEALKSPKMYLVNYDLLSGDVVLDFFQIVKKFFKLKDDHAEVLYRTSLSTAGSSAIVNRSLDSIELVFMQRLTSNLLQRKIPEERIRYIKRLCSDTLLSHNSMSEPFNCPANLAYIIEEKTKSAVASLRREFNIDLTAMKARSVFVTPEKNINEFSVAASEAVGLIASKIPPLLPVVYFKSSDKLEFDGNVDHFSSNFVAGWMVCKTLPASNVLVLVAVGDFEFTLLANFLRSDVVAMHPVYSPYCGYFYEFDSAVSEIIRGGVPVKVSVFGEQLGVVRQERGDLLVTKSTSHIGYFEVGEQRETFNDDCKDVEFAPRSLGENTDGPAEMMARSIASRDQKITEQHHQINQMRIELLRAEAQLVLLKDLMIGSRDEARL